jgi:deoxyribose-phosphate aldolase
LEDAVRTLLKLDPMPTDREIDRMQWSARDLARHIDHTLLKPEATAADIARLCSEALEHQFWSVCVHGSRVVQAAALLEGSEVKVAAVVGFPLGAMDGDAKRYETEVAIDLGAQEIDMVLNIGRLKDRDDRAVFREIRDVVEAAQGVWVKVILETCLLTEEEKLRACSLSVEAGARFVKTSTGFGSGGATVDDVRLMRQAVGSTLGVKASGGIRDTATALAMLEAGANRLGTSAGVAIVKGHAAASGDY